MFCNNCGTKLEDGTKFCDNCGAATGATSTAAEKKEIDSGKGLLYSTIIIALVNAILPFLKWVEVPALNTLSSWFGGSSEAASYTLFGYIFAGVSDSTIATIVILVLALVALVSVMWITELNYWKCLFQCKKKLREKQDLDGVNTMARCKNEAIRKFGCCCR